MECSTSISETRSQRPSHAHCPALLMVAVLRAYEWVDPHTHTHAHTRDTTLIESTSSSWSLQQRLTDIRAAAPDIGGTSTTSTPGISLDNALVVIVRPQQSRPRIGLTHGLGPVGHNKTLDHCRLSPPPHAKTKTCLLVHTQGEMRSRIYGHDTTAILWV